MAAAYLIFRALRTKKQDVLLRAYEIYIRPILEFATTVYSPYKKKDILALEKVQHYVTRRIVARCSTEQPDQGMNYEQRNAFLNIKDLQTRRTDLDAKMMMSLIYNFRSISSRVPHYYNIRPSRLRGPGFTLFFSAPNSAMRKNSFFVRSSILFNKNSRSYANILSPIASD